MPVVRLATRGSPLARAQAEAVGALLCGLRPDLDVELVVVRTRGDRLASRPLSEIGGQGVFAKEVQRTVVEGEADVAVHSAKDLPPQQVDRLVLAAFPPREDPRDALVGVRLRDLSPGAKIATGSPRRRAQLANLRPDLTFVEARGNIATRLAMVEHGLADAVVVAACATDRLGISDRLAERMAPSVMLPQVGQGALAVECRGDDEGLRTLLAEIDHEPSRRAVIAERSMLATMGASCSVPVGGWAQVEGADCQVHLRGLMASADGRVLLHAEAWGDNPEAVGREVADRLLVDCGGRALEG